MKQVYALLIGLVFLLFACEKDNNNGDNSTFDVSGFWLVTETITGNCEGEIYPQQEVVIFQIEQTDSNLTFITYPEGFVLEGTILGNTVNMEGEFPSGSGTNYISFTGSMGNNGTTLSGTSDWEWSNDFYSCSGTAIITGEKAGETNVNYSGTWNGIWISEEYELSGTFTVDVVQTGNNLGGTIDVPDIALYNAELEGEVHGHIVYFGDIDGIIKFAGIADNNSSSGSYTFPDFGDEGTWTASRSTK
jgi:hypothetical protein